MVGTKRALMQR